MTPAPAPPRLGHHPELDGLRGLAVLLVVAYHTMANRIVTLSSGLDLFFVLSGFLITTLLLEEHQATGDVSLGNFFRRRGLRLLPALALYLAVNLAMALGATLGVPTLEGVWDLRTVGAESVAAGLYVYPVILALWDDPAQLRMPHLHSLAQEEWFYFFWAPVMARALRRDRLGRVVKVTGAVLALLTLARIALVAEGDPGLVGPLRPDMMFLGAMVGVGRRWWLTQASSTVERIRRGSAVIGTVGTLAFVASNAAGWIDGFRVVVAAQTGTRLFAVFPLIAALALAESNPLRVGLRAPILQWYGRLSYGVYLWHVTILLWVNGGAELIGGTEEIRQNRPTWVFVVAAVGGGTLAAWASYHAVERRFMDRAKRYRHALG